MQVIIQNEPYIWHKTAKGKDTPIWRYVIREACTMRLLSCGFKTYDAAVREANRRGYDHDDAIETHEKEVT